MKWHGLLAVCGLVVATQAAMAGAAQPVKNDTNRDGRAEILLHKVHDDECEAGGSGAPWLKHYNGHVVWGSPQGADNLNMGFRDEVGSFEWRASATGDFDGNGLPDLFWERRVEDDFHEFTRVDVKAVLTRGEPVKYVEPDDSLGDGPMPSEWTVVGSSDFAGAGHQAPGPRDRISDLLWYNHQTGELSIWLATAGVFPPEFRYTIDGPGGSAVPRALGDLDADGQPEIIFLDAGGLLTYWSMDGLAVTARGPLHPDQVIDPNWEISGAGDIDGNRSEDLLFWNPNSHRVAVWYMGSDPEVQGPVRQGGGLAMIDGDDEHEPLFTRCDTWYLAGPR